MIKIFVCGVIVFMSVSAFSQKDSIQLLKPTGNFSVGTMTYEWTDETRGLKMTAHKGDKRTIVVQLWYPAHINRNSTLSPYSSISEDDRQVISNSYLRPSFSDEINRSNLILISPGRGVERFLYSTIIEELASHGFIVASVDMPQIGYVIYLDGMIVRPSSSFQPPSGMMAGPYEKVDQFFEEPTELGFEDLTFVLRKIVELNQRDPNERFRGKINVDEIGLFGHSLGGRIAGKFAAENTNVKAYISMEGIPPREIRYQGLLDIPVALMCSSGTWPYAKENYFSLIDNTDSLRNLKEVKFQIYK